MRRLRAHYPHTRALVELQIIAVLLCLVLHPLGCGNREDESSSEQRCSWIPSLSLHRTLEQII